MIFQDERKEREREREREKIAESRSINKSQNILKIDKYVSIDYPKL